MRTDRSQKHKDQQRREGGGSSRESSSEESGPDDEGPSHPASPPSRRHRDSSPSSVNNSDSDDQSGGPPPFAQQSQPATPISTASSQQPSQVRRSKGRQQGSSRQVDSDRRGDIRYTTSTPKNERGKRCRDPINEETHPGAQPALPIPTSTTHQPDGDHGNRNRRDKRGTSCVDNTHECNNKIMCI